jgi:hypothetical protein
LKALAENGETVSADLVLWGIADFVEQAKANTWMFRQSSYELADWLSLLPYSDRPRAVFEGLDAIPKGVITGPHDIEHLFSSLGHSPSQEAEGILFELAERDPRTYNEYAWTRAVEQRQSPSAVKKLLTAINQNTGASRQSTHGWAISRTIAALIRSEPNARTDLFAFYHSLAESPAKRILEGAIAESANHETIIFLVEEYALQHRQFDGGLQNALRRALVDEVPSPDYAGMKTLVAAPAPLLRKDLFTISLGGTEASPIALRCLQAIDDLREDYGSAVSEPRHPDISTGKPWPLPIQ